MKSFQHQILRSIADLYESYMGRSSQSSRNSRRGPKSRNRRLVCESMEPRMLMAFNAVQYGTDLQVTGTSASESVTISGANKNGVSVIEVHTPENKEPAVFRGIKSLHIASNNGNDKVYFNTLVTSQPLRVELVDISLAGYSSEIVFMGSDYIPSIVIDTSKSVTTYARIQVGSVGNLDVTTGNGQDTVELTNSFGFARVRTGVGSDTLKLASASVDRLVARLGNGNDTFEMSSSSVRSIDASLGRGADRLIVQNSNFDAGVVNGGAGEDSVILRISKKLRGLTRKFEHFS